MNGAFRLFSIKTSAVENMKNKKRKKNGLGVCVSITTKKFEKKKAPWERECKSLMTLMVGKNTPWKQDARTDYTTGKIATQKKKKIQKTYMRTVRQRPSFAGGYGNFCIRIFFEKGNRCCVNNNFFIGGYLPPHTHLQLNGHQNGGVNTWRHKKDDARSRLFSTPCGCVLLHRKMFGTSIWQMLRMGKPWTGRLLRVPPLPCCWCVNWNERRRRRWKRRRKEMEETHSRRTATSGVHTHTSI